MGTVPEDSQPRFLAKLPLNIGDWIDPSGVLETIHARWYFCKAIELAAPDMVDELGSLIDSIHQDTALEFSQERFGSEVNPKFVDWANRWNVNTRWVVDAAINTMAWRLAARMKFGQVPLNTIFLPSPFGPSIEPEAFSKFLEAANPGWTDPSFRFVVPEFAFTWHPTQHRKADSRKAVHDFIDRYLDSVFEDTEAQLLAEGAKPAAKGQTGTVKMDHFIWAVQHYIHERNWSDLAREHRGPQSNPTPAKIRSAVQKIGSLLDFEHG